MWIGPDALTLAVPLLVTLSFLVTALCPGPLNVSPPSPDQALKLNTEPLQMVLLRFPGFGDFFRNSTNLSTLPAVDGENPST
jgi:hypothetical protein